MGVFNPLHSCPKSCTLVPEAAYECTPNRDRIHQSEQTGIALYCFIAVLVIGDIDYITGYQTSILAVYILPIGFAVIEVGPAFAVLLAISSVVISIASDLWDGIPSSEMPMHLFNKAVALAVFFISIGLLHALKRILLRRE